MKCVKYPKFLLHTFIFFLNHTFFIFRDASCIFPISYIYLYYINYRLYLYVLYLYLSRYITHFSYIIYLYFSRFIIHFSYKTYLYFSRYIQFFFLFFLFFNSFCYWDMSCRKGHTNWARNGRVGPFISIIGMINGALNCTH